MTDGARPCGRSAGVSGAVVRAETNAPVMLGEVARVGEERLLGEVIELEGRQVTVQVYEETAGLGPGDPHWTDGAPLCVELGPGLLGGWLLYTSPSPRD